MSYIVLYFNSIYIYIYISIFKKTGAKKRHFDMLEA